MKSKKDIIEIIKKKYLAYFFILNLFEKKKDEIRATKI
jgi:hypothetical protein